MEKPPGLNDVERHLALRVIFGTLIITLIAAMGVLVTLVLGGLYLTLHGQTWGILLVLSGPPASFTILRIAEILVFRWYDRRFPYPEQ